MAINQFLNMLIAESGSWQSFIDFKLPEDDRAKYLFINKYDNFYLSLMANAIEFLSKENPDAISPDVLSIAKGLEIFSLREKREYFSGVNKSNNNLYTAGLYYKAGYSASAWILSRIYPDECYVSEIDKFISSFLKRDLRHSNRYSLFVRKFFDQGDFRYLTVLRSVLIRDKSRSFNNDMNEYFSYLLAQSILDKFLTDNIWLDLLNISDDRKYWKEYVRHNVTKKVPVWSFFPSQRMGLEHGLLSQETCSMQMPTSSGKTSICELIIFNEFKKDNNCRILYLAPYRALASELKQTLALSVSELGISSKTIYGGNLPTVEERNSVSDVNLLISTPEKFMAIEDIFPNISTTFSTIICDEGHLLDDESRGLSYELLLSRFKSYGENDRRFVFVSAIIPNISVVNSWLGGTQESLISSDYKPTELDFAFLKKMDYVDGYYLDVNPHKIKPYNFQLYKYLFNEDLQIVFENGRKRKIRTKKGISVATALKATNSGTVALFAPHKRGNTGVEDLAKESIDQLVNNINVSLTEFADKKYLENLTEYFTIVFGFNYLLTQCSKLGFLYHHGDFSQNIREIIEDALRQERIRLIICTNTLAEGVNLPIKTLVIHSTKRFNRNVYGYYEDIRIRDLKNLVGRAGRAGKETKGLVIAANESDFGVVNDLIREKGLDPVKGQLYNIIVLITNYLERERLQISIETLDSLSEQLQELLDSIDISMIDLLAEEVHPENLKTLITSLIEQTLSYYQANVNERTTLKTLFELRVTKLKPIVEEGKFSLLKKSGTNIRLYEEIMTHFNFENDIWNQNVDVLNEDWLNYIFLNGVFELARYKSSLETFNNDNKCQLNNEKILMSIRLWISGSWYENLCNELEIETFQALRLINTFVSFNIQSVVSSIIRIKELINPEFLLPPQIINWPTYLQFGINSQLKLDLIEMGLTDRVAVLGLSNYLEGVEGIYTDFSGFKSYLIENSDAINDIMIQTLPVISYDKLNLFLKRIKIRNLL